MPVRPQLPDSLIQRLRRVRMLVFDVDGVLTDARTYMHAEGEWRRFYSIRDGYGIVRLMKAGYKTGIITGSKALDIRERAKALGVNFFFEGHLDKLAPFEQLQKDSGLKPEEIAYMGDDIFDVPLLERVGFAATVSDAMEEALEVAQYQAKRPAGNGAVREVCEMIIQHGAFAK